MSFCYVTGKVSMTKVLAKTVISKAKKMGTILRLYSCDICGMYHVSKMTREEHRRIK